MKKPALVILAAGIGSRYGGEKQIDPVGPSGEIILDYTLYDAGRAGFGRAVFVIRPEQEAAFADHLRRTGAGGLKTAFVTQKPDDLPEGFAVPGDRKKPWGTGHAVRAARKAVDGPFAVANADDFYGRGSLEVLGRFLRRPDRKEQCCLVAFRLANTLSPHGSVSRGVCEIDREGCLVSIKERTRIETAPGGGRYLDRGGEWIPLAGDQPVSMNLWGFGPALFPRLETQFAEFLQRNAGDPGAEFQLPAVIDRLIREEGWRCRALPTAERWFGMTYREDRDRVRGEIARLVEAGTYPERLRP